ncbi:hypothetical protein GALMADRAFT_281608 [Galerina marginata CBS 339.88]|uniref:Uncharacterized protein n=1 Tax=Galerina marginata (strain CBS 339.88) TaxID=685588 RepID=A0A067SL79_GALM3|nr:hypothetical protein GALMADRAFT_281608 [Galerina marginata CBS 339.88]
MSPMSRAGLVCLFLCSVYIRLAASAPLAERLSSSAALEDGYDSVLFIRAREFDTTDLEFITRDHPSMFNSREFRDLENDQYSKRQDSSILYERESDELDHVYTRCDNLEPEFPVLYRRNIFSKMRDGFRNLGKKVSSSFHSIGSKVHGGFQSFGRKTQAGFQTLGRKIGSPFQKLGGTVRSGFQSFGGKVNGGFQKISGKMANGLRTVKAGFNQTTTVLNTGFKTAGQFMKKNGAKIAKVGLKLYAAYASTAAKIVKYVPGVGQPLSMALKGVAMGAKIGSSQIHADMSGKFGEVSNGIDYVLDPVGSISKLAVKGMAKQDGGIGKAGNIISSIML